MYKALYRQERPETFQDVIGQEHIIRILENQIKTDKVGHAYLFCGTRGTGKTTIARLLAKGVNCLHENAEARPCGSCAHCQAISEGTFVDVIEMDAASNRGITDVREIKESVKYPPAVGRKKVYIIDEVHMLTTPAFNALLKTLEEPPENIIFILATTDPEQLPQTILSRCQRMDFKRLSHAMLVEYYSKICESRGIELKKGAADIIATSADGSVRDGLSILEQSLASGEKVITEDIVNLYGGAVSQKFLIDLTNCVLKGDVAGGIVSINSQIEDGKESNQILKDWIRHFRNLMVAKVVDNPSAVIDLSSESVDKIVESCKNIPYENICDGLKILAEADKDSRGSAQPRIFLDLALMKLSSLFNEKKIVNSGRSASSEARQGVMRLSPADTISSESRQQFSKTETKEQQPDSAEKQQSPIDDEAEKSVESESHIEVSREKAEKQKNDNLDSTEEMENAENMDDVWAYICEMVVKERPSIGTLKQRAKINNISQNTITIEAENEITAKRLEDGMQIISEAATVVLGRPIRGQIAIQGKENKLANSDDDTIQRLKELLGDIPIKMQ
ncbi:MAG: DNA polymerase III subunit gamma/tau [Christensenellales bacterium]